MAVLDVGCGTGAITSGIADATGEHGLTVGLDRNAALLADARFRNHDNANLHFVRGDIYALPFAACFDIVSEGVLSENDRAADEAEYLEWIGGSAMSQTLYLLAVEGTVSR